MSHYVGLDVTLKEVWVCIVDAEATGLHRASARPRIGWVWRPP